ncbi:hypothetical protein [Brevibacillus thermoruber]|uniref:hypothetical protein n=1 Tax=Brevibacillus thermoruber TaxID=33942 RepID=UPI0005551E8A|nr:hypothetical protein [Brevibacillus thermoruber]
MIAIMKDIANEILSEMAASPNCKWISNDRDQYNGVYSGNKWIAEVYVKKQSADSWQVILCIYLTSNPGRKTISLDIDMDKSIVQGFYDREGSGRRVNILSFKNQAAICKHFNDFLILAHMGALNSV